MCKTILNFRRCFAISAKELQINEEIKDPEIRLVGTDGVEDSVMSIKDAQALAVKMNLDLVKIVPGANPPVCRIMDYSKFCFEQRKKEKEARKKQKIVEVKEIRLSLGIDKNDLETKLGHVKRFLQSGNRVKVTIRLRGREMMHASLGEELLREFAERCAEWGTVERMPKLDGRSIIMFIASKQNAKK